MNSARWKTETGARLISAVAISAIGGVLGIAASKIISAVKHSPSLISPTSIVVAVSVSALVGVFFGV